MKSSLKNKYIKKINHDFPEIVWNNLKIITKWWSNDIVILDDNIVFRFPKYESVKENLKKEIDI